MIDLKSYIELYITNECNLTCSNCNRFNNYDFRGHYAWEDSQEAIKAWAQRITAPMITIIGGEPTLHPELEQWVRGAARAWPDRPVVIQTNGLKPLRSESWWQRVTRDHVNVGVSVAIHSDRARSHLIANWGTTDSRSLFDATKFADCTIQRDGSGFRVHDSDPGSAWRACGMRYSHTILSGRLYRCPMVAVLPQFQKQYQVYLSDQQQSLLHSYKALEHDCDQSDLQDFVHQRDQHMPQCRLCPAQYRESVVSFDGRRKKYPLRLQP